MQIPVTGLFQREWSNTVMKNLYESKISDAEVSGLSLIQFEGSIYVVSSKKDIERITRYLRQKKILGFDTESRPSFKKGNKNNVAILQLATDNEAFIFQLNKSGLHKCIINILTNDMILKVGAAIKDDLRGLRKLREFEPAGFIELQKYVKNFGIEQISLKKMAAIVLGGRISKSQQTSNWEQEKLTEAQLLYAATDAWCSYKIFTALNNVPSNE